MIHGSFRQTSGWCTLNPVVGVLSVAKLVTFHELRSHWQFRHVVTSTLSQGPTSWTSKEQLIEIHFTRAFVKCISISCDLCASSTKYLEKIPRCFRKNSKQVLNFKTLRCRFEARPVLDIRWGFFLFYFGLRNNLTTSWKRPYVFWLRLTYRYKGATLRKVATLGSIPHVGHYKDALS